MSNSIQATLTPERKQKSPVVVISQPMYFPWVGILEQIQLCDHFVFYDDVQFARGFFNRVQVKTCDGIQWMTVPLRDLHRGQLINEIKIDELSDWRKTHMTLLRHAYTSAPYKQEMLNLVEEIYSRKFESLADLSSISTLALAKYFGLDVHRSFKKSSDLSMPGSGTQRLVNLCQRLNANSYVTGHGASKYLDHEKFEAAGIGVEYMKYAMKPYQQDHGDFTPYVTALDLVANRGNEGITYITGKSVPWRDFVSTKKVTYNKK